MHVEQMIAAHPNVSGKLHPQLARCVEACLDCAQTCSACADACLGEAMVAELVQCIRLNLDCADVCLATGLVSGRRSGGDLPVIQAQLAACRLACARCAEECEAHAARHVHCQVCAEVCRACEAACDTALRDLPKAGAQPH